MSDNLPRRLPLPDVLALAGYSRTTLRARQNAGKMPWPIDRGGRGGIYDRDAVLKALGMAQDATPDPADAWTFNADAYHHALAGQVRGAQAPRRREQPRVFSGSGQTPPLRLVAGDPTSSLG